MTHEVLTRERGNRFKLNMPFRQWFSLTKGERSPRDRDGAAETDGFPSLFVLDARAWRVRGMRACLTRFLISLELNIDLGNNLPSHCCLPEMN